VRPANGIRLMHGPRACKHGVIGMAASFQKSRGLRNFLYGLLLTILLTTPSALFGQGYFGTVSGEITDPSGAPSYRMLRLHLSISRRAFSLRPSRTAVDDMCSPRFRRGCIPYLQNPKVLRKPYAPAFS
jgi:hypothetical protein